MGDTFSLGPGLATRAPLGSKSFLLKLAHNVGALFAPVSLHLQYNPTSVIIERLNQHCYSLTYNLAEFDLAYRQIIARADLANLDLFGKPAFLIKDVSSLSSSWLLSLAFRAVSALLLCMETLERSDAKLPLECKLVNFEVWSLLTSFSFVETARGMVSLTLPTPGRGGGWGVKMRIKYRRSPRSIRQRRIPGHRGQLSSNKTQTVYYRMQAYD